MTNLRNKVLEDPPILEKWSEMNIFGKFAKMTNFRNLIKMANLDTKFWDFKKQLPL